MKRSTRAFVVLAMSCLALGIYAGIAWTHTRVAESRPADDATVDSAPDEVYVRFGASGPPQPGQIQGGRLEVYDDCGKRVDDRDSQVDSTDSSITVSSGGQVQGRYEVQWFVTSGDGDRQAGFFSFDSRMGPECITARRSDPRKDSGRALDLVELVINRKRADPVVTLRTASRFGCADVKPGLRIEIDYDADSFAEAIGRFGCRAGRYKLQLFDKGDPAGVLKATRPDRSSIRVKLSTRDSFDEADVAAGSGTDRAPDHGLLRAY